MLFCSSNMLISNNNMHDVKWNTFYDTDTLHVEITDLAVMARHTGSNSTQITTASQPRPDATINHSQNNGQPHDPFSDMDDSSRDSILTNSDMESRDSSDFSEANFNHMSQLQGQDQTHISSTAISIQQKALGSLFAGAIIKKCTFNIHLAQ